MRVILNNKPSNAILSYAMDLENANAYSITHIRYTQLVFLS